MVRVLLLFLLLPADLCRSNNRLDTTMVLYKSLLGIHNAYAVGSPAHELVFEYGPPSADKGDLRKISIELGAGGKMTGARVRRYFPPFLLLLRLFPPSVTSSLLAQLVDSSENIQDLVEAYLDSQDIRSLVQEVRARIGR
jgi:hypothetical protein